MPLLSLVVCARTTVVPVSRTKRISTPFKGRRVCVSSNRPSIVWAAADVYALNRVSTTMSTNLMRRSPVRDAGIDQIHRREEDGLEHEIEQLPRDEQTDPAQHWRRPQKFLIALRCFAI